MDLRDVSRATLELHEPFAVVMMAVSMQAAVCAHTAGSEGCGCSWHPAVCRQWQLDSMRSGDGAHGLVVNDALLVHVVLARTHQSSSHLVYHLLQYEKFGMKSHYKVSVRSALVCWRSNSAA
jgi:hypothetical protein